MLDKILRAVKLIYFSLASLVISCGIFLSGTTHTSFAEDSPLNFQLPHHGYISTYFSGRHPGIDLATPIGTPIKPIEGGIVTQTGFVVPGLGLSVTVDHGQGYKSVYGHMAKVGVLEGQIVSKSSVLGTVGMTGNTSGPHTHIEVYKDNRSMNLLALVSTEAKLASTNAQINDAERFATGGGNAQVPSWDEPLPRTGPGTTIQANADQLPKTGLPFAGAALAALLPGGMKLKKLLKLSSDEAQPKSNDVWGERIFKKTST